MKYFGIVMIGIAICFLLIELIAIIYGTYKYRTTDSKNNKDTLAAIHGSIYIRLSIEIILLIWGTYIYDKF
jgi:hypothetical protein